MRDGFLALIFTEFPTGSESQVVLYNIHSTNLAAFIRRI